MGPRPPPEAEPDGEAYESLTTSLTVLEEAKTAGKRRHQHSSYRENHGRSFNRIQIIKRLRRSALRSLCRDEAIFKEAAGRCEGGKRIGVDVNVEQIFVTFEETLPQRSEVEVEIREEKKRDLGFLCRDEVRFQKFVRGTTEEFDVVWIVREDSRREDSWGEDQEKRERYKEGDGEDKWRWRYHY